MKTRKVAPTRRLKLLEAVENKRKSELHGQGALRWNMEDRNHPDAHVPWADDDPGEEWRERCLHKADQIGAGPLHPLLQSDFRTHSWLCR